MSRKPYDPLSDLPSSDVIRRKLAEHETVASKLRILLETAEAIERVGCATIPELSDVSRPTRPEILEGVATDV